VSNVHGSTLVKCCMFAAAELQRLTKLDSTGRPLKADATPPNFGGVVS